MEGTSILLFRGIVGIVAGLFAFFWPGLTLVFLVVLFGDGVSRDCLVGALLTQVAAADVARDRAEPGIGAGRVDELCAVPPGLEQRVLRHVLRRCRPDDRSAQAYEPGAPRGRPQVVVVRRVLQCGQLGSSGCVGDH